MVELDEEVAGDPECEEVDRGAADDLVGTQVDGEERVHEGEPPSRGGRDREAPDPAPGLVGAPDPPEGAHQHHPLEADVHDAGPLGEHPADRRERQRRREDEHLGDQARVPDLVQVRLAGARRELGEADADDRSRDRAPPHLQRATRRGEDAAESREDADDQRPRERPRLNRRSREPEREDPEHDPERADRLRLEQARAQHALDRCGVGAQEPPSAAAG